MLRKLSACIFACLVSISVSMPVTASEIDPSWWRGTQAQSVFASVVGHVFDGLMAGYDLGMFVGRPA